MGPTFNSRFEEVEQGYHMGKEQIMKYSITKNTEHKIRPKKLVKHHSKYNLRFEEMEHGYRTGKAQSMK